MNTFELEIVDSQIISEISKTNIEMLQSNIHFVANFVHKLRR